MIKLLQLNRNNNLNDRMSLILDIEDWEELFQQASQPQVDDLVLDNSEIFEEVPESWGWGFSRYRSLSPGVRLEFTDCKYNQDFRLKTPVHEHPFQMMIVLSGYSNCTIHPTFSEVRSYFSGSGISPAYVNEYQIGQHIVYVNVEIEPEVLESHFSDMQLSSALQKQLYKREDWKVSFYPTVIPTMRSLAHQMWNAPYHGAVKQMYLQAKVFELFALYLDLISNDSQPRQSATKLKPKTVASLHYAKDILASQLEHPPSLTELARQVGVGERTLRSGFQELFGTTVVGYLTFLRLQRAELLLREKQLSVAEVANLVGYSHLGYFAKVFKNQFGISPSQCKRGKLKRLED